MWFGEVWQGGDWVGERNAPGMAWYGGAGFGSSWRGKARQGPARLGQYRGRQAKMPAALFMQNSRRKSRIVSQVRCGACGIASWCWSCGMVS